jgi:peptidoglycan/xylan/chitin deacetylase (PgdA/CDA1 family)
MYHGTPPSATGNPLDVAMPVFRDQIHHLLDQGNAFVRFGDALDPRYYSDRLFVSLTFDDGHESNLAAFEFLRDLRIVPTAFIVSKWSQHKRGFISADAIAELADCCDFGSHGASHTALTDLSQEQLINELNTSKSFLESALARPITTMSAPGGMIDDNVVETAKNCGYRLIGNSVELINSKPSNTINRICVRHAHGATHLAELAKASRLFWLRRRTRRVVLTTAARCLGDSNYQALKGLLPPR